ncbi:MAG: MarR family transcriptional regulator [Pseudomonadota bacterium]
MSDDHLALHLDRFFRRMHGRLHEKALVFDTRKVGPFGAMVLLTLADHDALPMQEIATRLARDKSQVTRMVHLLKEKGLITRSVSDEDARINLISITEDGMDTVKVHRKAVAETIEEVLGPLSEREIQLMTDILKRA